LEQFGDIFLWMVQFEELKKPSWVEAQSNQVKHYLQERQWAETDQIINGTDPPIVTFGKDQWTELPPNNEVWEVLSKGEIYENLHGLMTKDERFIWKNYGRAE
jgi:hypothetical protein